MLKFLAITAIVLVAAVSSLLFYRANLIVRAETPVFERTPGGPWSDHQIAVLHAGEKFSIHACVDNKSYLGYEIKLRDGRTGYVLAGKEVEKRSFLLPPYSQPIVWNCV